VFGAEVGDKLGGFGVGDGFAEGRHLLAAVEDLIGDFGGGPELVFGQGGEDWAFLAADAGFSVAVGATLAAKEEGAGLLGGFVFCGEGMRRARGDRDQDE